MGRWENEMKFNTTFLKKLDTTLDLICKVCEKFLAESRETPDKEAYEGKPSLGRPINQIVEEINPGIDTIFWRVK